MFEQDEWTQQDFFKYKNQLEKEGKEVILVDTILKPIDNVESIRYNPYEMSLMPESTVFVFYCDTGKTTKERLPFYKKKLPNHKCVSLRGGRAYWRPNYQYFE